jgi:hypothetical protein
MITVFNKMAYLMSVALSLIILIYPLDELYLKILSIVVIVLIGVDLRERTRK